MQAIIQTEIMDPMVVKCRVTLSAIAYSMCFPSTNHSYIRSGPITLLRLRRRSHISRHSRGGALGEQLRELLCFLPYSVHLVRKENSGLASKNYLSSSRSSFLSGKNSRDSRIAKIARDARYRNASPSKRITSHRRAQASKGRWSRKRGTIQSRRYSEGDI